jgi:hypothetical protein
MASLNITATTSSRFTINIVGNPTNFIADGSHRYTWKIAHASGTITGFDPAKFSIITTNFAGDPNVDFQIVQDGSDIEITYVPEPTGGTLLLVSGAALLGRRRRRDYRSDR